MKSASVRAEGKHPRAKPREELRKRGPYVSDLIVERRRRLIETTKAMIAEKGADGFTIRELTERAQVSITVVYSTYGDKEGLVAAAIQDFYEKLPMAQRRAPDTLKGVLALTDEAAAIILANAGYSRSLSDLYFSRTADPRIYMAIRSIAVRMFGPWLERIVAEHGTEPGLPFEFLCTMLANERWAVIFDWARGRIADGDLAKVLKTSFLVIATGLTTATTQLELRKALHKLGSQSRTVSAS